MSDIVVPFAQRTLNTSLTTNVPRTLTLGSYASFQTSGSSVYWPDIINDVFALFRDPCDMLAFFVRGIIGSNCIL